VERGQLIQLPQLTLEVVVDQGRLLQVGAAVDDPVDDGVDAWRSSLEVRKRLRRAVRSDE
jgi:hypothetical protein